MDKLRDKLREWSSVNQNQPFHEQAAAPYKSLDVLANAIRAKLAENKDQK